MRFDNYYSKYKNIFVLYLFQTCLYLASFSFIPVFLENRGFSLDWLLLFYVICALSACILIPLIKVFRVRTFLILSFICYILICLSLLFFFSSASFFLVAVLLSLPIVLFWIPFNLLFFSYSSKSTNATDSSIYLIMPSLLGVFIPAIGALIIRVYGYSLLFGLAAVLFLIPLFFVLKKIPERVEKVNFKTALIKFKNLKTITFIDGALYFFNGVILPVYFLKFMQTATSFGLFLSYLGLIGFVISVFVSRHSDRTQKRKLYISLSCFLMAVSILLLAFAHTLTWWIVLAGVFSVFFALNSPLRLAVSLDVKNTSMGFWSVREFFLNLGRVFTLSLSFVFFYYQIYWAVFVMFGLLSFAYPFLVHYKLKEVV